MANIFDLAEKQRAALLAAEQAATDAVLESFATAWHRTRLELEALARKLDAARAAGEVPAAVPTGEARPPGTYSPSWLYRERRLTNVLAELERGMADMAENASMATLDAQREAVGAAQHQAHNLMAAALEGTEAGVVGSFTRLPADVFDQLVGHMADGSPLLEVFDSLGQPAGFALERALVAGVANGWSGRRIVEEAREALGGQLARALTIARTEVNRAHREATRLSYEANADVVAGWTWMSALDRRTCAVCWAMHGTKHHHGERLDGHPNCRCAMVPITDDTPKLRRGREAFEELTEAEQLGILGPAKLRAYQAGDLELGELVGRSESDRWGTMRRERSMRELERLRRQGRVTRYDSDTIDAGEAAPSRRGAPLRDPTPEGRLAAELEVDVATVRQLRAELKHVRAAARAEAAATRERVLGWLEVLDAEQLAKPPRAVRRLDRATGAMRTERLLPDGTRAGGEWDWLEGLHDDELKRLHRSWLNGGRGAPTPDEVFPRVAAGDRDMAGAVGAGDMNAGQREWLDYTRTADAAGALARGKLPSPTAYGNLDPNDLIPELHGEGFDATHLFASDEASALRHLRDTRRAQEQDWLERHGGVDPDEELAAWRPRPEEMGYDEWQGELSELERRHGAGELTDDDLARWAELLPEDYHEAAGRLSPEELHELIRDTERRRWDSEKF